MSMEFPEQSLSSRKQHATLARGMQKKIDAGSKILAVGILLIMVCACSQKEDLFEQIYVCGDKGWGDDGIHDRPAHPKAAHVAEGDEEVPRYGRSAGYGTGIGPSYGIGMGGRSNASASSAVGSLGMGLARGR